MKKNYSLICLFFIVTHLTFSQSVVNIPDSNFKNYLLEHSSINTNNDSEIQISEAQSFTGKIDIKGSGKLESQKVKDLTGLEAFTTLTAIDCSFNGLTQIDVSKNIELIDLHCHNNELSSIDVTKNINLEELECFNNKITSLDVTKNVELVKLWCTNNLLTNIDVTQNTRLRLFEIEENQFTSLDVTKNIQLTTLVISRNNFTSIDISNNTQLLTFYARANDLKSIDISKNFKLDDIVLVGNDLSFLDMSKHSNTTRLLAYANANLTCVKVEDESVTPPTCSSTKRNGWCLDDNVIYSETCSTTNINNNEFSKGITLFPNPVNDILQISIQSKEKIKIIEIYNSLGKMILKTNKDNINTSKLSKGVYWLRIESISNKIAIRSILK
ncbi:T9SS type A sorting domain-containing protein [Polaribacter sp. Z022]|uniref:T9SS type A sorting domain-containing protein n=1 Tax=Polaribacter sp. Z022 TaxID=2927125 RepID=UPI002021234C|nr:T9SS type A sorting domain-containing protein [Polaribacter sp. Z022]MCL7754316.1 T9SS type A sorting domain-containing protein [Polaribacter sp. Z022]